MNNIKNYKLINYTCTITFENSTYFVVNMSLKCKILTLIRYRKDPFPEAYAYKHKILKGFENVMKMLNTVRK